MRGKEKKKRNKKIWGLNYMHETTPSLSPLLNYQQNYP